MDAVAGAAAGVVAAGGGGPDDVLFVVESNTARVKRSLSEFQSLRAELQFRFPKTRLPVLPARRWENQIRSIGETVGGWGEALGGAVVTVGAAAGAVAGAAGAAVVSSVMGSPTPSPSAQIMSEVNCYGTRGTSAWEIE